MKVSKKDIVLLIALAGVLIAVCSYFFVYKPYTEKTDALGAKNRELQARVTELQNLKDNEAIYIEETEKMSAAMEDIYNLFPPDVRTEDAIMLAVDLANASPLDVKSLSIGEPKEVYHVGAAVAEAEAAAAAAAAAAAPPAEGTDVAATEPAPAADATQPAAETPAEPDKILYSKETVLTYEASYDAFKSGLSQIVADTDRKLIGPVTASYNQETGMLTASTSVVMLYMTGTDREYVAPVIPFIPQGIENIFGTINEPVSNADDE